MTYFYRWSDYFKSVVKDNNNLERLTTAFRRLGVARNRSDTLALLEKRGCGNAPPTQFGMRYVSGMRSLCCLRNNKCIEIHACHIIHLVNNADSDVCASCYCFLAALRWAWCSNRSERHPTLVQLEKQVVVMHLLHSYSGMCKSKYSGLVSQRIGFMTESSPQESLVACLVDGIC